MTVETTRADYDDAKVDWSRLRDVIAGQRAMHANKNLYLRRPEGMEQTAAGNKEWADYAAFVPFFEATARTLDGLTGMAFYQPPHVDLPDGMKPLVADVTMDGVSLEGFAEQVVGEVIGLGRSCLMVDMPPPAPSIKNRAEEIALNRRPFLRMYRAEAAFNWRSEMVRNSRQLTEVRLFESELVETGEFEAELESRIRVLQLTGNDAAGWIYSQRVFVEKKVTGKDGTAASEWNEDMSKRSTPTMGGKPLNYIPFWFVNAHDQTDRVSKAPLIGLANTNVAHFNTTAQLERVLSFVGAPQLYILGVDATDVRITVGSADALVIKNQDATVGYVSCPADGLSGLESRLAVLEQQMALLGARMLAPDKKAPETAETAGIHRQGEISVLASCCNSASAAITDALRVMGEWNGTPLAEDSGFRIDTDFFEQAMGGADALNFVKVWQAQAIAYTDLVDVLKRGKVIAKDRTADDVQAEVQSGAQSAGLTGLTDPTSTTPPKRKTLTLPAA